MKRLAILTFAVAILLTALLEGRRVEAQDDAPATVSALRTEVADLRATVEVRGARINAQRTQIAELREVGVAATPTAPAFELEGVHDAKIYDQFAAGRYAVEADCEFAVMQVYVLDAAHGIVAQPVSRSAAGEADEPLVDLPEDGEYKVEVYCAGRWRVVFTLDPA